VMELPEFECGEAVLQLRHSTAGRAIVSQTQTARSGGMLRQSTAFPPFLLVSLPLCVPRPPLLCASSLLFSSLLSAPFLTVGPPDSAKGRDQGRGCLRDGIPLDTHTRKRAADTGAKGAAGEGHRRDGCDPVAPTDALSKLRIAVPKAKKTLQQLAVDIRVQWSCCHDRVKGDSKAMAIR
jgi:hypothetical protein